MVFIVSSGPEQHRQQLCWTGWRLISYERTRRHTWRKKPRHPRRPVPSHGGLYHHHHLILTLTLHFLPSTFSVRVALKRESCWVCMQVGRKFNSLARICVHVCLYFADMLPSRHELRDSTERVIVNAACSVQWANPCPSFSGTRRLVFISAI